MYDLEGAFSVNKTDMVITYKKNRNQILFAGLDDAQKLKSITPIKGVIEKIWIEEGTEVSYQSYKELTKRLRGETSGKKQVIITFNPILKTSWIYTEFFNGWEDSKREFKGNGVAILKTTYKDNAFLTEDDKKLLENETDEYYYNVYTLGNWGVLGAVIFKNWSVEDLSEMRKTADNYCNGLDFGFAEDEAALIRVHYDRKHKSIYVLDELYEKGLTNDVLAREIKNIIGYEYVTCDSAEPKSIQELKNEGISALGAKKGKDSVQHGLQWLQQHKIFVDMRCQNFKNEIAQYKWQEDKQGNVIPIPVGKRDHLISALRYALEREAKTSIGFVNINI
jgi:phage terminase large subunit